MQKAQAGKPGLLICLNAEHLPTPIFAVENKI